LKQPAKKETVEKGDKLNDEVNLKNLPMKERKKLLKAA
jgi:hypothetical protein